MQALIIKQDGNVYYIADLPYKQKRLEYGISIQSAILVKNQEYAKGLITERFFPESNKNEWTYNIGKPYEFPDLKVRIEVVEEPNAEEYGYEPYDGIYTQGGWNLDEGEEAYHKAVELWNNNKQLAIIEEEKGEEGEDEMWINIHKEISISVIEAINTGRSLPRKESIEALKQQYAESILSNE